MGPRVLAVFLVVRALANCDCFGGSVAGNKAGADAVFRGRVIAIEAGGSTKLGRHRFKVRFRVSQVWKGPKDAEVTIHGLSAGADCRGFDFELQKEYVVFAHEEIVSRNLALVVNGKMLAYEDWGDALPYESRILTVSNCCTYTSEVKDSRNTIRLLGTGTRPRISQQ